MRSTRSAAVVSLAARPLGGQYVATTTVLRKLPCTSRFSDPIDTSLVLTSHACVRGQSLCRPLACGSYTRNFSTRCALTESGRSSVDSNLKSKFGIIEDKPNDATQKLVPREDEWERAQHHFRLLMRSVANPVTIVTACVPGETMYRDATVGALVNSFSTVSFSPDVMVSFNLRKSSTTYQAIVNSGYCAITFPDSTVSGQKVAEAFTKGNTPPPLKQTELNITVPNPKPRVEDEVMLPPVVHSDDNRSGLAFGFCCQYKTCVECGDHIVIVAKVLPQNFLVGPTFLREAMIGTERAFPSRDLTLNYVHGQYTRWHAGNGLITALRRDDPHVLIEHELSKGSIPKLREAQLLYKQRSQLLHNGDFAPTTRLSKDVRRLPKYEKDQYRAYYQSRLRKVEKSLALLERPNEPKPVSEDVLRTRMRRELVEFEKRHNIQADLLHEEISAREARINSMQFEIARLEDTAVDDQAAQTLSRYQAALKVHKERLQTLRDVAQKQAAQREAADAAWQPMVAAGLKHALTSRQSAISRDDNPHDVSGSAGGVEEHELNADPPSSLDGEYDSPFAMDYDDVDAGDRPVDRALKDNKNKVDA